MIQFFRISSILITFFLFVSMVACQANNNKALESNNSLDKSESNNEIDMLESNTLPGLFLFTLDSENTGRSYTIGVGLPASYVEGHQYPVIFLTDAEGKLHTTYEVARGLALEYSIPEVIVVGVFNAAEKSREEDFSPPLVNITKEEMAAKASVEGPFGGAGEFYAFVRDELIPVIDREFATDTSTRVYFGHSMGGLFGLYTLQQEDDPFSHYLISSPSVWYDDRIMLTHEIAAKADLRTVYLSVGEFEQIPSNLSEDILALFPPEILEEDNYARMVEGMTEVYDYLNAQEGFEVYAHIEEATSHITADKPAFLRGIQVLLEGSNQGELRRRSESRPALPWE